MSDLQTVEAELHKRPRVWLVTGCAGFIGSNLVEALLRLNQTVTGLDNFATGHRSNIEEIQRAVPAQAFARFTLIEGDIRDLATCRRAMDGVDVVLHQAALGSVPRSIADPITTNQVNIDGFLNMLVAARDTKVDSFVYAASSSTYGDHPALPKEEDRIGRPLSPYAVTKYVNELYAHVFAATYGVATIGLRYFNAFGPRQNPSGPYAAVIPKWIAAMLRNQPITINGDGETSRDFCYVANVVQANLLAAVATPSGRNQVYNVALNARTSLNQLFTYLVSLLSSYGIEYKQPPAYGPFRAGDVRHSRASVDKAASLLGYAPTHDVRTGLEAAMPWYLEHLSQR